MDGLSSRSASGTPGASCGSATTTSSARPSLATTRPCRRSCRRSTTTAICARAPTRAGTACRARRTTPRPSCSTGSCCPVHERPVEWFTEENWFFELSRFSDRLLEWYDAHPSAIFPETRRNEALGIIRGGPAGHLHHANVHRLGDPGPVGHGPRVLRLVRRPRELHLGHRLRTATRRASNGGGRPSAT